MRAEELLDLARRAACRGGIEIARHLERAVAVTYKGPTDPVSAADRASETAILALIGAARSDDGILSEEGSDRASTSGLRWVVDPLDGTVNFLYGIPHFAVSVACEKWTNGEWRCVAGVVHDHLRGETFTAILGDGAWLNEAAISVTDPVALPAALVATEFSYHAPVRSAQVTAAAHVLGEAASIRSTGSSTLDLCWTAAGRFDGFYENELSRWDWAAGALIVTEAGGTVTGMGTGVLAAGPSLHQDLRTLLGC